MVTRKKTGTRRKTKAMGDDPLTWIKQDSEAGDKVDAKSGKAAGDAVTQDNDACEKLADTAGGGNKGDQKTTAATGSSDNKPETRTMKGMVPIILDQSLTISDVDKLHESLKEYIDGNGDIYIDAGRVHVLDMAGIQLLVVFVQDLEKNRRSVQWQNLSPAFRKAAELMDLTKALHLPDA